MKALSVQQPWAWLIVHGHKPVENRTWSTQYRGPLLIHAGKTFDVEGYRWVCERFPALLMPGAFDVGGIVGGAHIVGCVDNMRSPWFVGPFGFVLERAAPLPFRPMRGQLGLFDVPAAYLAGIA